MWHNLCHEIKCNSDLVSTRWKQFEGSCMPVCCKGTRPRSLKSTVDHDRWETTGQRRFRVNRTISSVNHCLSIGASYCLHRRTMRVRSLIITLRKSHFSFLYLLWVKGTLSNMKLHLSLLRPKHRSPTRPSFCVQTWPNLEERAKHGLSHRPK